MNNEIHRLVFVVADRRVAAETAGEGLDARTSLEVNVIFTDEKRARAALKCAGALARSLQAHLNLVVVKQVPLAFPLERPPIPVSFTEEKLHEFASEGLQGPMDTTVQLYYCRNRLKGLLQALKPKSLVVIGGRRKLWPTKESRLAATLRAEGHQVIFPTDK
jgi:hypothetical protein